MRVRMCCEGGLFGPGCLHDHCKGPTTKEMDEGEAMGLIECKFHGQDVEACEEYSGKAPCEAADVEEPRVSEEEWLLGPACSTAPEECEACQ